MKIRSSRQREHILEYLKGTSAHPTADSVYAALKKKIPNLSLGTVYRNLKLLSEQGLVQKIPFGSTFDRYEATIGPHYHLICETCGTVTDFVIPYYDELHRQAEKNRTFKISRHRVDFFGVCEKCQLKHKTHKKKESNHG